MSVLNIAFLQDAVWFGTDTIVYNALGSPVSLCERKAEVAPSGRFISSTRGLVATGDRFDALASEAETVDQAEALANDFIRELSDDDCDGGGFEVTVAGWSDSAGDLVVKQAKRRGDVTWEPRSFVRGVYLAPGCGNLAIPRQVAEAQFVAMAMAQGRIRDRFDATMCVGGVLHLSVATKTGCSQRIAAVFDGYDRDVAALGFDPNAEDVAAFRMAQSEVAA
ncbi:hypothetical protein [Thalassobaculum litoreum]|uniref:Uncharacterized protein n=1 Tax=Thalassobaculum litoreum DSM 18839 TaxID=1123362 RepID=A0A8G2EXD8_9PROT|nr:hypothetical protein [Thalassobaculum litoreum]SDF15695.1 hypothetical protein SAMN05660686_00497 [Thalassobaculum litoreum DSM 18839]